MTLVMLEPVAPWARVKHSTTEPLRSHAPRSRVKHSTTFVHRTKKLLVRSTCVGSDILYFHMKLPDLGLLCLRFYEVKGQA